MHEITIKKLNEMEKFRILIQLALVDNRFEETERKFIKDLASRSLISSEELDELIVEELKKKNFEKNFVMHLGFDEKIEILSDMVRVMRADGEIYLSEIKFCEMIAKMFGFEKRSIGVLSKMLRYESSSDWPTIKETMERLQISV